MCTVMKPWKTVAMLLVLAGLGPLASPASAAHDAPPSQAGADSTPQAVIFACDFESDPVGELPAGWVRWGQQGSPYQIVTDAAEARGGTRSCRVEYTGSHPADEKLFGGCGRSVKADAWLGRRVQLSAYIRTDEVNGHACLCLRVDGPDRSLAFDNMNDRAVHGTTDWNRYALVVDVPRGAEDIAFGLFLGGSGRMWVDDLKLETVSSDVSTTDAAYVPLSERPNPPGVFEARGAYEISREAGLLARLGGLFRTKPASQPSLILLMPVPLCDREQTPLSYEVRVDPVARLEKLRIYEDRPGNFVAEVQLEPPGSGERIAVAWRALVLCGPRAFDGVPERAALPDAWPEEVRPWLSSTRCVQADHERIRTIAKQIRGSSRDVREIIRATLDRVRSIQAVQTQGLVPALDAVTALDQLGSCTSNANLVAALLRAQGVPARILAGYPTWSGPLQTHYIVEAFVPGYGWYPIESTLLQAPWPPTMQVQVAVVPPEYEDRSEMRPAACDGVPYLSLTEYGHAATEISVSGVADAARNCDHVARTWRTWKGESDPAAWAQASDLAKARWARWINDVQGREFSATQPKPAAKEDAGAGPILGGPYTEQDLADLAGISELIERLTP